MASSIVLTSAAKVQKVAALGIFVSSIEARKSSEGCEIDLESAGSLELSIEDFVCLDRSDADNKDTFPHPQLGVIPKIAWSIRFVDLAPSLELRSDNGERGGVQRERSVRKNDVLFHANVCSVELAQPLNLRRQPLIGIPV